LNEEKVLERIPNAVETEQAARHLDAALLQRLEVRRFGEQAKAKRPKGNKVPAGQSYTVRNEDKEDDESEEDKEDDESEEDKEDDESEEDEDDEQESDETGDEDEDVDAILEGAGDAGPDELPDLQNSADAGSYVVAIYEEQWFLAEVVKDQNGVPKGYTRLAYMLIKGKNSFAQPLKPDLHVTLEEDIVLKHVSPEPVNSRGCLGLSKTDYLKVLSLMVVFTLSSYFYLIIFPKLRRPDHKNFRKGFSNLTKIRY
jgi:predicted  nucleic acid-binding Zn-ribbon protein